LFYGYDRDSSARQVVNRRDLSNLLGNEKAQFKTLTIDAVGTIVPQQFLIEQLQTDVRAIWFVCKPTGDLGNTQPPVFALNVTSKIRPMKQQIDQPETRIASSGTHLERLENGQEQQRKRLVGVVLEPGSDRLESKLWQLEASLAFYALEDVRASDNYNRPVSAAENGRLAYALLITPYNSGLQMEESNTIITKRTAFPFLVWNLSQQRVIVLTIPSTGVRIGLAEKALWVERKRVEAQAAASAAQLQNVRERLLNSETEIHQ
jgi:hypothetical protein